MEDRVKVLGKEYTLALFFDKVFLTKQKDKENVKTQTLQTK